MKAPKKTLLATALLASPVLASALGLGGIEVKSGLNEPLVAEIPVSVNSPAEADSLSVNLASADDFARVGIDSGRFNVPLDFAIVKNARGQTIIRVTTKDVVREPFVQLLLQVNWNKGKLLREYSVLLDPPVTAPAVRQAPAVATAPTKSAEPLQQEEVKTAPRVEPLPEVKTETKPVSKPTAETKPMAETKPVAEDKPPVESPTEVKPLPATSDSYTTKSGDTLYVIAKNHAAPGTNLDQMMVAILRMNPNAFQNGNINALKKGQILRMPQSTDLNKVSVAEARKVVREQHSLWRGYQMQSSNTATSVADPGTSGAMNVSRPTATQPRMEVVAPARNENNGKALDSANAEIARLKEELTSRSNESSELKARIAELEKLKAEQEKLLTLKNDQLAELQRKAEAAANAPANTPVETPPVAEANPPGDTTTAAGADASQPATTDKTDIWGDKGTDTGTPDTASTDPNAAPADGTTVTPMPDTTATDTSSDTTSTDTSSTDTSSTDSSATDSTSTDTTAEPSSTDTSTDTASTEPGADTSTDTTATDTASTESTEPAPTPWYMQPMTLGGIAGGVGLLGLLGWLFTRKKKPAAPNMGAPSMADNVNFGIPAMSAGTAGFEAAVDEDEMRIRQAIQSNPQDLWAHLDLLRLYYSRGDAANFEASAASMYGYVVDPSAPQWQEARSMGAQLTPNSSLFAAAPDFGSMDNMPDQFNSQFDVVPPPTPAPTQVSQALPDFSMPKDEPLGALDLSSFDTTAPPTKVLPVAAPSIPTPSISMPSAPAPSSANNDFSFDLSLDEPAKPAKAESAASDFNFDFSFDKPAAAAPVAASLAAAAPAMAAAVTPAAPSLDLDSFGLPDSAFSTSPGADADDFMIGDDAVGTKLDLARAYLDMGDPDGAKSMLDEVMAEGNDAQKRTAQELLARIS